MWGGGELGVCLLEGDLEWKVEPDLKHLIEGHLITFMCSLHLFFLDL